MLFLLTLLLSCSDPVVVSGDDDDDGPQVVPPQGEVIVRSCFEGEVEEKKAQRSKGPSGAPKSGSASKAGKARMEEAKREVSEQVMQETLLQLIGTPGDSTGGAEISDLFGTGEGLADLDAALAGAGIGGGDGDAGSPQPEESAEVALATHAKRPKQPEMDWGAKIYLSNDDSMSLASAQRVLYALKRNRPIDTAQIRPHELLNYFSFDTQGVEKGKLFSVQGTAEQNEDTLSLALSVKGANLARRPLDLTLVIDRSGSMSGEGRMDYTKKGLIQLTDNLVRGDRVDLVLFDSGICTPVEGFVVGRDEPEILVDSIRKLEPLGSTDLDSGLREAYRIQASRLDAGQRNRRVVLITDAQLNTGNVNTDLVSEVGRQFDENNIRLTGVGVGSDFNDEMLDKLTEKGKGAYVYLGSEAVVER
ncbi:MAG: VWA domain-containing protein, partial [Proteobacteria bacterium]|nr:VWA domain-containing protein [Pseudomonadota bacterium]